MCVLIAAAFVVSLWWSLGYKRNSEPPGYTFVIAAGRTVFETGFAVRGVPDHWYVIRHDGIGKQWLWPDELYYFDDRVTSFVLPLWVPFLALLLPTLLLWFLDRRRPPPGHCRCGYNLTGLTSGRCPECGTPAPAPRASG
jgi:hypothetical protein